MAKIDSYSSEFLYPEEIVEEKTDFFSLENFLSILYMIIKPVIKIISYFFSDINDDAEKSPPETQTKTNDVPCEKVIINEVSFINIYDSYHSDSKLSASGCSIEDLNKWVCIQDSDLDNIEESSPQKDNDKKSFWPDFSVKFFY
ncbi:MAG: hypothetical protein WDZ28_04330 [Simkaniaceae bacterium]